MGINQSVNGTAAAGALIDCCLATGNLRPGSGPFSLTGQANSMGTRVCSSKGSWPGHRPFADPDHRRAVAETWGVPVSRFPDDTGPGPVGIVSALGDDIDAVYAVATNPVAGMPDATRVRENSRTRSSSCRTRSGAKRSSTPTSSYPQRRGGVRRDDDQHGADRLPGSGRDGDPPGVRTDSS